MSELDYLYFAGSKWEHILTGSVLTLKTVTEDDKLEFKEFPKGHAFPKGYFKPAQEASPIE